jgi:TolB protein
MASVGSMRVGVTLPAALRVLAVTLSGFAAGAPCIAQAQDVPDMAAERRQIEIQLSGSLQNPAWSPTGEQIVFTRYRGGYGVGPADLFIHDLARNTTRPLLADGFDNVNQPGAAWNERTGRIAFSSTRRGADQIFTMRSDGSPGSVLQHTNDPDLAAYEPSFSPDGRSAVFETHPRGVEHAGIVEVARLDAGGELRRITEPGRDCRQPNWSPRGRYIVYQCHEDKKWDLWIFDLETGRQRKLTAVDGDKTDASFSPDGRWIVCSVDNGANQIGDLFIFSLTGELAAQLTRTRFYEGAPSWSPDGRYVVFESTPEQPNANARATIAQVRVPERFWRAD